MNNPIFKWAIGLTAGAIIGGFLFDGIGVMFGVLIGGTTALWIMRRR